MKLITELDQALETVDHLVREDKDRLTVKQVRAISWLLRHIAKQDVTVRVKLRELRDVERAAA